MDVQASHLLPRQAIDTLHTLNGVQYQTGISGSFAWILSSGSLTVWPYLEGRDSRVRTLLVPESVAGPDGNAPIFAAVLPQPRSSAVTVIVCSAHGALAAWIDASYLSEPILGQISPAQSPAAITSFSATVPQESAGAGPVFVATAGAADGSWLLVQGSVQGLLTRHIASGKTPQAASTSSAISAATGKGGVGMLSALGSALSWGYTEVFDPSAKLIKRTPSGLPVSEIVVTAMRDGKLRVLVLTKASLECWMVTQGLRPSEALQWSFRNLIAMHPHETVRPSGAESVNMTLAAGPSCVFVWMTDSDDSGRPRHFVQRILLDEGSGQPAHDWCIQVDALDQVSLETRPRMACAASGDTCLLLGPRRSLIHCGGGDEASISVSQDMDALALAAAAPAAASTSSGSAAAAAGTATGHWVVLSGTYGVIELSAGKGGQETAVGPRVEGPLTSDQVQQIFQLLDSTLGHALLAQQQQAGRPLLALVSGLGRRLEALGALTPVSNMAVLSRYSTHITDLLPKQWAEGSMGEPGASFSEQLGEKGSRHTMLLACLAESGVYHRLIPEVQRVLFDNAEKLDVATALLALQQQQYHLQQQQAAGAAVGMASEASGLLIGVLQRAGELSSSASASEALQPLELFYARPSLSTPALLRSLAEAAAAVAGQAAGGLTRPNDQGVTLLRVQVVLLARVLGTAVAACQSRRQQLQQAHRISPGQLAAALGRPGWLEDREAREQVEALLQACQAVRSGLAQGQGGPELSRSLFGITEVLLTAHAAAVAAAVGSGSGDRSMSAAAAGTPRDAGEGALAAYRSARSRHVPLLLQDALSELEAAGPSDDPLLPQVEALCRQHHCYPQLFTICRTLCPRDQPGSPLSSSARLHHYMANMVAEEGAAESDTFSAFVFQRLYAEGLHAELLMLPPPFWPSLKAFLMQYPQLLWLLQLRSGDVGAASGALMQTANLCKTDFEGHRRLVCLAKLASHASSDEKAAVGQDGGGTSPVQLLELLELQRRLGLSRAGQGAMEVPELVDAALALARGDGGDSGSCSGGEAALMALEALTVVSPTEREANKSRWDLTWRQLLNATDWTATPQAGQDVGEALAATPLYRGAVACHGRGAFGFGASVQDTGPVKELRALLRKWAAAEGGKGRKEALAVQAFDLALSHCQA